MEANIHLSVKIVHFLVLVVILAGFSSGLCSDTVSPPASCENVALGKAATQSSIYTAFENAPTADRAVDGEIGNCLHGDVTHTDDRDTPPFWEVRLGKVYNINSFRIYARAETCGPRPCSARLAGFTLLVRAANYRVCYSAPEGKDPGAVVTGSCSTPMLGDRIMIQQPNKYLSLCEVLIYACKAGTYGPDCGQNCGFCAEGKTVCDTASGDCPERPGLPRCMPGYSGQKCQTDCSDGMWGADCVQSCGQCYNNNTCDKTSGACPRQPRTLQCIPGYQPPLCNQVLTNLCLLGADCLLDCNCKPGVTCDPQTGCPGNCTRGWDGPTCQRQNVALGRPTTQSSNVNGFGPGRAVDGNSRDCLTGFTHTAKGDTTPSWEVTLDSVYSINSFRIYNRGVAEPYPNGISVIGSGLAGFSLSAGDSSGNYQVCYRAPAGQNPGYVISGTCTTGGPVSGNKVRIQVPGPDLSLCEVLIYVCSPGTYGPDCDQSCGFCTEGRAVCDAISGDCPELSGLGRCIPGYTGAKCQTVCTDGKWGADCPNDCGQCNNGAMCDKTSGECPPSTPRCSPGYLGQRCDTACDDGRWGLNCYNRCGHCNTNSVCDKMSGECPPLLSRPSCSPGYKGMRCDAVCSAGYFGSACQNPCGHCVDGNLTCDHVDGTCTNCATGWQGGPCKQPCSKGTYGPNCKLTCSLNCKDGPTGCDIKTGVCTGGCTEGFSGAYCHSNPDNTGIIAGVVVGVVVVLGVVIILIIMRRSKRQSLTENPQESFPKTENKRQQGAPDIGSGGCYNPSVTEDNAYECDEEHEYSSVTAL